MRQLEFGIIMLILIVSGSHTEAQNTTAAGGISFNYTIQGDSLACTLEAKTNGWIGVGFNDKNSIVNSDLLLFNIIDGIASSTDLYVKGVGNPQKDSVLGGANTIRKLNGIEKDGITKVTFTIPLRSGDPFDFEHRFNEPCWLILAYSVEDDFSHHSRVRKHVPFKLEVSK